MDEKEYKYLLSRFKAIMKQYNLYGIAQDVLHEYLIKRLEGKAERQKLEFFVIDYLRRITRSRRKGHEFRIEELYKKISIDFDRRI